MPLVPDSTARSAKSQSNVSTDIFGCVLCIDEMFGCVATTSVIILKCAVRVHDIKTSRKQLKMLLEIILTLPLTRAEKFKFWRILMKLCAYLPVESCAEGARHQNIQKTTLNASRNHTNFVVEMCRKV